MFNASTVVSLSPSRPLSQGTSAVPIFTPLVEAADAHSSREFCVFFAAERFCQSVGHLVARGYVFRVQFITFHFLVQEMVTHFNVFGVIVEFRILCNRDCGLVVHEERCGSIDR